MSQPCLAHPALNAAALLASLVLTIGDANAARVVLGAPASEANLTMGCLYPMAGRAAMYGQDSIAGIDIALRDLEAERAAGRETPRLRVIIDDDLSKASYGVRLAEDFLRNDEVDVLSAYVSGGVEGFGGISLNEGPMKEWNGTIINQNIPIQLVGNSFGLDVGEVSSQMWVV